MKFKIFITALLISALISGCAYAARISIPGENENTSVATKNYIENDPRLPAYENPTEFDVEDGDIHISFKGVFRGLNTQTNEPSDSIYFAFVVTSKRDINLRLDQSELFDHRATRFRRNERPYIGNESTWERELLEGIPMRVICWFNVPIKESEILPTIARTNIRFNGQWVQFRNIKVQDRSLWKLLEKELGL